MNHDFVSRLRELAAKYAPGTFNRDESGADQAQDYAWLQEATTPELHEVLDVIVDAPVQQWREQAPAMSSAWVVLIRRQMSDRFAAPDAVMQRMADVYLELDAHPAMRALLLRFLLATSDPISFRHFTNLLTAAPPRDPRLLWEVFADLVRVASIAANHVFPKLLEGLKHPHLVVYVLDFANLVVRRGYVQQHPAAADVEQLTPLLSGLAERLRQLQETRPTEQQQVLKVGRQVADSVALGVSLCDALSLIGDPRAIPGLYKTLEVQHRRLRVEAAASLARLDDQTGLDLLPALAADPAERLRVLEYAHELGLSDRVEQEFASPLARREAELVTFLAQPTQFGMAPHRIELVDQRDQPWPGYDEPQTCHLFRFAYQLPAGEYQNIGIAGPVVYSLNADLSMLSAEDIYAIFAGWDVQHPDIFATEPDRVQGFEQVVMGRLLSSAGEAGYENVAAKLWGHFLGRLVLVASATRDDEPGWVMTSEDAYEWLPLGNPQRPLGATEAFHLFVGRNLLSFFSKS